MANAWTRTLHDALPDPEWLQGETANGVTTFDLTGPNVVQVRRPVANVKASTLRIVRKKAWAGSRRWPR